MSKETLEDQFGIRKNESVIEWLERLEKKDPEQAQEIEQLAKLMLKNEIQKDQK